jgi:hypothetical protein
MGEKSRYLTMRKKVNKPKIHGLAALGANRIKCSSTPLGATELIDCKTAWRVSLLTHRCDSVQLALKCIFDELMADLRNKNCSKFCVTLSQQLPKLKCA